VAADADADFRRLGAVASIGKLDEIVNRLVKIVSKEKLRAVIRMEFQRIGGYKPTARNLMYLTKWKRGQSIGSTMTASLKAKGLIPRTSKTLKGKKVMGAKYRGSNRGRSVTRRNRRQTCK
jgi:hypothetical protein